MRWALGSFAESGVAARLNFNYCDEPVQTYTKAMVNPFSLPK